MTMRTTARFLTAAVLSLGLMAGCATTGDDPASIAEQAIADAKAANADAKALGYEWRDTGKMIKDAEKALADGDAEKATSLANAAKKQALDAQAQKASEDKRLMDLMATTSGLSESSASAGAGADSYSVVRGDNLWDISGKSDIYGDSYQWPLIYKANRDQIKDPDLIFPGQNLEIDRNASAAEIDAAINHAKTRGAWSVGDVEQSDLDYLAK